MSQRSSDSYGDIPVPEISTEDWVHLFNPQPGLSDLSSGSTVVAVSEQTQTKLEEAKVQIEYEESDGSLWEQVSDIRAGDLADIEAALTQAPEPEPSVVNNLAPFPPLYLILDDIFDNYSDGDIEEGGVSVAKAAYLIRKYKPNRGLSVSNLVQPLWCEYKHYYNLVGLERYGTERRLKEFEVPRKEVVDGIEVTKTVIITVDQAVVEQAEVVKTRGLDIHERLEREVVGPRLPVRADTYEEVWAHKLINMITGLATLRKGGDWRELEIFGFIRDIPFNGKIDKLRLEPSPSRHIGNVLRISDTKTKAARSRLDFVVPREHMVQLMVYKQLLDGLLNPAFDWIRLFQTYKLEPLKTFGDGFIATTQQLAVFNDLGEGLEKARNLDDLIRLWVESVKDLSLTNGEVDSVLSVEYYQPGPASGDVSQSEKLLSRGASEYITSQTFEYDEEFVQEAITQSLDFWLGIRGHAGTSLEESWKCNVCEYRENCEWRSQQAVAFSQKKR